MGSRLSGRVALISGAARGLGAAQAELFAREGAAVVIGDVLAERAEELAAGLREDGLLATAVELDVRDAGAWAEAVAVAESEHWRLDLLVNNAGVVAFGGADEADEEEWERVLAVNQRGVFLGMRAAIPALRRAGGGAIVNISSVFGVGAVPGYFAYQASKAAIVQMTRAAAVEYAAEGIRVNSVAPGLVITEMTAGEPEEAVQANLEATPMGRAGTPEEIAHGVLYLASEESAYVTGVNLAIDGGYLAQ